MFIADLIDISITLNLCTCYVCIFEIPKIYHISSVLFSFLHRPLPVTLIIENRLL